MKAKKYVGIFYSVKIVIITSIFIFDSSFLYSQISFDFENNDFIGWEQIPEKHWEISETIPLNGKYSLRHAYDNPMAGTDQISYKLQQLPDTQNNISWSFSVRHLYNPSSANNWAVFLCSDAPYSGMHPKSAANAIIAGVNYVGDDDFLSLWKQENGKITCILSIDKSWEDMIKDSAALIGIGRNPAGEWTLKLFNHAGKPLFNLQSDADKFFPVVQYFGIFYEYSASQDQKFYFDDFTLFANFIKDTIAPSLDSFYLENPQQIILNFNEPLDFSSVSKSNFEIKNHTIKEIQQNGSKSLRLIFEQSITSGQSLKIRYENITDLSGNQCHPDSIVTEYYQPEMFDILITEIMSDPDPAVNLPAMEYLELFNRSGHLVNLKNWSLLTGTNEYIFPYVIMDPGSYLVITRKGKENEFGTSVKVTGLFSSDYTLPNEGSSLILKDSLKNTISFCLYENSWIEGFKSDGGWSMEMKDPENPCSAKDNWTISLDKNGGTPGKINSISTNNKDLEKPEIESIRVINDSCIIVRFNESIVIDTLSGMKHFSCDHEIGNPVKIFYENLFFNEICLVFNTSFTKNTIFRLSVSENLCDCAGNIFNQLTYVFALGETPDKSDLVINEILFNAHTGGSDFVEIYNRSEKTIDIGKILINTYDTLNGEILSFCRPALPGTILLPDSFAVFTTDKSDIISRYQVNNRNSILESECLPGFDDRQGIVSMSNHEFQLVDSICYNRNFHTLFLSDKEGVSLERISPEINSLIASNWQSAAQTAGYATPGYKNSTAGSSLKDAPEFSVIPEVFTPNMDGIDDVVRIKLASEENSKLSVSIYSSSGMLVKNLISNEYTRSDFIVSWDGSNNSGQLTASGIYIIYIHCLYENGNIYESKKTCVLSRK